MAIEFSVGGKNFTGKDILLLFALLTVLVSGVKWYLDTRESNKAVPLLQAVIGEMKIEVQAKSDDIEDNTQALEEINMELEQAADERQTMGTNLILLMRDVGVEPVE
jgi:hypothetical protein